MSTPIGRHGRDSAAVAPAPAGASVDGSPAFAHTIRKARKDAWRSPESKTQTPEQIAAAKRVAARARAAAQAAAAKAAEDEKKQEDAAQRAREAQVRLDEMNREKAERERIQAEAAQKKREDEERAAQEKAAHLAKIKQEQEERIRRETEEAEKKAAEDAAAAAAATAAQEAERVRREQEVEQKKAERLQREAEKAAKKAAEDAAKAEAEARAQKEREAKYARLKEQQEERVRRKKMAKKPKMALVVEAVTNPKKDTAAIRITKFFKSLPSKIKKLRDEAAEKRDEQAENKGTTNAANPDAAKVPFDWTAAALGTPSPRVDPTATGTASAPLTEEDARIAGVLEAGGGYANGRLYNKVGLRRLAARRDTESEMMRTELKDNPPNEASKALMRRWWQEARKSSIAQQHPRRGSADTTIAEDGRVRLAPLASRMGRRATVADAKQASELGSGRAPLEMPKVEVTESEEEKAERVRKKREEAIAQEKARRAALKLAAETRRARLESERRETLLMHNEDKKDALFVGSRDSAMTSIGRHEPAIETFVLPKTRFDPPLPGRSLKPSNQTSEQLSQAAPVISPPAIPTAKSHMERSAIKVGGEEEAKAGQPAQSTASVSRAAATAPTETRDVATETDKPEDPAEVRRRNLAERKAASKKAHEDFMAKMESIRKQNEESHQRVMAMLKPKPREEDKASGRLPHDELMVALTSISGRKEGDREKLEKLTADHGLRVNLPPRVPRAGAAATAPASSAEDASAAALAKAREEEQNQI